MVIIDITDTSASAVHQQMNQFRALVQRYHADPDYRGQVEADPVAAFREQGMELPSNIAVRVLAQTDDTHYIIMPPDPNMDLGDEMLAHVAGSGGLSSVMSVGSLFCVEGTISTNGSMSTVGSL